MSQINSGVCKGSMYIKAHSQIKKKKHFLKNIHIILNEK